MNRLSIITVWIALMLLGGQSAPGKSGHDLFQKGLVAERAEGDLEMAMGLYKQLIKEFPEDRPLVAKTLLQLGQCYEKLGRQDARKVYERVVREFADQPEPVRVANLHLQHLDTGDPGQAESEWVWTYPTLSWGMAPSPDGRYVAFGDVDTRDLAIRDIKAGTNTRLTHNQDPGEANTSCVRFSPDGKWLAYDWFNDKENVEKADLRVIRIDGSDSRIVYHPEGDVKRISPHAWFPDGNQILGRLLLDSGEWQAVVVSVADGSVRVVEGPEREYLNLCLSPDGRHIAYDIWGPGSRDIVSLSVDGGEEISVVQNSADDGLLGWSPDGGMLVFRSDRRGAGSDAWVIQMADGKPQGRPQCVKKNLDPVTPSDSLNYGHFTRDGSFFNVVRQSSYLDAYTASLDPVTGKVTDPSRTSERYQKTTKSGPWSPDGKHQLYLAGWGPDDSPERAIVVRSVQSGQERKIPLPPEVLTKSGFSPITWSPDGGSLLVRRVASRSPFRIEFCRLNVRSGTITPIASPPDWARFPAGWSADGTRVFSFQGGRTHYSPFRAMNLETGQEEELYRAEINVGIPILSPDRQHFAFTSPKRGGPNSLMILPVGGGEPRELYRCTEEVIDPLEIAWTPDGRYLLFMTWSAPGPAIVSRPKRFMYRDDPYQACQLWRIPVKGGEPQKLEMPDDLAPSHSLYVRPDGKQIAFTRFRHPYDELRVTKNFLPDLASPPTLIETDDPERPFGLTVEVPDPVGDDVKEFAAEVTLSGDENDWNAPQWCEKVHPGAPGSLDGPWEGRFVGAFSRQAWIRTIGDWVHILHYGGGEGYYLIKARRQGNRLVGRHIGVQRPDENTSPWVGVIISDERIDGLSKVGLTRYRWDFRRNLLPSIKLASPASHNYTAVSEPVLLQADVAIAEDVTVRRVEFLIDGTPVGDDRNPPYAFNWVGARQGRYRATAKVYDSGGGTEESTPVEIFVGLRTHRSLVARPEDDAKEFGDGQMKLDGPLLELVSDGEGDRVVAMRFGEIGIPKGTVIQSATLQFTTARLSTEPTDLILHAELAANAPSFEDIERNITSRRKSSASVKWSPEPWNVQGERAAKQQTPDLSPLIQEVVAQPDWQKGNALVLIISGSGLRTALSHDRAAGAYAPMLHMEY